MRRTKNLGAPAGVRCRAMWMVLLVGVAALGSGGCVASGTASESGTIKESHGPLAEDEADGLVGVLHSPSRGRFRLRTEVGVEGHGVIESVVVGAFDESNGSFEATLDLDRLVASARGSVLAVDAADLGGELVVRGAADLVFIRADERGWILLPGALEDVLAEVGIVRPDALLDLLDRGGEAVVEVEGDRIGGVTTVRYSGWLGRGAMEGLGGMSAFSALDGVEPLTGAEGSEAAPELLERLVRFDVWVDERGRARRLVIEVDLETVSELSRRVDGHADGIDKLRLRHEVEWFDLDIGVTIEPPPRSEVSVIDIDALEGDSWSAGPTYDGNSWGVIGG